ncbi:MAG: hypothetical protein JSW63_06220 [Ignavibacterium sp.]|nr:MAG: hypothetical protein JSW63_06220 [Ignavibacterium sp.]
MEITEKELSILRDTNFLLTKSAVLEKIYNLLEDTRTELIKVVNSSDFPFPKGTDTVTGKISRGENYKNLPYMVLDYPTLFSNESSFAFRTMVWWGNFFSSTLHLEGEALGKCRKELVDNINKLLDQEIFIGVGDTPWQYHYGEDNYLPITKEHSKFISNCKFLKLSKKIEINEWQKLPLFTSNYFDLMLSILSRS